MSDKAWLGLKMRQLPKPEYRLMKALVQRYNLRDESELFAVALRLLVSVERFTLEGKPAGRQWIAGEIDRLRSASDDERSADYDG